jgi:hypothetical protein
MHTNTDTDMNSRSPSGSLCPYPYIGGELHPLKLRSINCASQDAPGQTI